MGANGLESVFVVTCTEKLYEDSFKWLLGLCLQQKTYPNIHRFRYLAMKFNILLTCMATIGAWLRLCALLRSEPQQKRNQAVPKKKTVVLQETGFTNLGPCNIYICIYICVCVYVVVKVNSFLANLCSIPPRKLQQIPMVVLLQQSVPPTYATCFQKSIAWN